MSARHTARDKVLDAALAVIRLKGYAATTVDDLCARAGVTKGAFFHHFTSKQDLAVAAAERWSERAQSLFGEAPYHGKPDPLERVLGYIEFRKSLLRGGIAEFSCLVGTMVQETYDSNPSIRDACARSILGHAATLESDIEAAIEHYGLAPSWTAKSLALYTQAALQGAFILAKATGGAKAASDAVEHLHRYVELLFRKPKRGRT